MSKTRAKPAKIDILPIFDDAKHFSLTPAFPAYLPKYSKFEADYIAVHAFLRAYRDVIPTFNAYRRITEQLLHATWEHNKSIFELSGYDIENFIKFCQNPPKAWIGTSKPPRFIKKDGLRAPNPQWRPFVATVSKIETRQGKKPQPENYQLSQKAIREIFAVLSSFYNFAIQESYTLINPVLQIRQKSKFIRKRQSKAKIRRLSELQWSFVIETVKKLADDARKIKEKKQTEKYAMKEERALFIITALYAMYLRVSELVISERWAPKMSDFYRDHDGNWWFTTVGKGNKERQIAVSDSMLSALRRWRKYLNLSPLPSAGDQSPLILKLRGKGGITNTNQIRNIVQECFDAAITKMREDGFAEEADGLQSATVHWLRHTGISDDVKIRPREHVRDDAGHSSSQTTDRYIDIDLRERHRSAKKKPIDDK